MLCQTKSQKLCLNKNYDMYLRSMENRPKRLISSGNSTNYRDFPRPGDYVSGGKAPQEERSKDMKPINNNIEVKVRKKVKTAGQSNPESLFHTTFGSFNQALKYQSDKFNMSNAEPILINDNTYEYGKNSLTAPNLDHGTPTLPNFDQKGDSAKSHNVRQPSYVDKNYQMGNEYDYKNTEPKAKSS